MAQKSGNDKTKFVLPKFRVRTKVRTPDGDGEITSIRLEMGSHWYYIEPFKMWYAEGELSQ